VSALVDLRDFLGLTRVDETTWSFVASERLITPGHFLYGGAGLAAGLAALEEASERATVWGSAQYLAHAPKNATVTLTTELAAVGHRVTQARCVALVEGREILTVNAALGRGELTSPVAWTTMLDVPRPLDCPPRHLPQALGANFFAHVESRTALGRTLDELDGTPGSPVSALWVRIPGHLEPSAATLALFGDYVSGGAIEPMGRRTMGRSLDNTLRVASLERTEWVLIEIHMHALRDGMGQGTAFLWSENGTLLATASQSFAARYFDDLVP